MPVGRSRAHKTNTTNYPKTTLPPALALAVALASSSSSTSLLASSFCGFLRLRRRRRQHTTHAAQQLLRLCSRFPLPHPTPSLTAACGSQKQKHSKLSAKKKTEMEEAEEDFTDFCTRFVKLTFPTLLPPVRRQRRRRLRIGFVFLLPQTNFKFSVNESLFFAEYPMF